MKKEDEIHIENYLCVLIQAFLEAGIKVDRFGNVFVEEIETIETNINNIIAQTSEEMGIAEDEIKEYLIDIYNKKMENPNFVQEGNELIAILRKPKDNKDNKKETNEIKCDIEK